MALPAIKDDLHFAQQSLQWVVSGYVVTYGGLLLLAGRAADLVGRRRILVSGLVLFAIASLAGGLAQTEGLLVAARLAQGAGAAMMSPAALSVLTTTFTDRRDRNLALGAWAAVPGLAGAFGVVLSGVLTEGPGWRWIFYLNVPVAILAGLGALALLDREPREGRQSGFDVLGAVLVTAGMLLLIYALVRAPEIGWGATETIIGLAVAAVLLAAFVANERRASTPLVPFSVFRIKGLAAANVTQLITFSGLYSMFFFLSLYMQRVLGYSPSHTGLAYLPLTAGFMISAGIATPLVPRIGTKPRDRRRRRCRGRGSLRPFARARRRGLPRRPATGHRSRRPRSRGGLHRRHHRRDRGRAGRPVRHRLRALERLDAVRRCVWARRPLRGRYRANRRCPRLGWRPSPGSHRRLSASVL